MLGWSREGRTLGAAHGDAGGRKALTFYAPFHEHLGINGLILAARLGRFVLAEHPYAFLAVLLLASSLWYLGTLITCLAVGLIVAALVFARYQWPTRFEKLIGEPARGRVRRFMRYRNPWEPAMKHLRLAQLYDNAWHFPQIRRILSNSYADRILVGMPAGQKVEDYEDCAIELAKTFGARRCAVRDVKQAQRLWLDFYHRDALSETIPALPVPAHPEFSAVTIGRTEAGLPWTVPILGTHVLLAGATGSGKGSVMWSLIRGLAEGIREGTVLLWGCDPKGGMELAFGRALFNRLEYGGHDRQADLLDDAVEFMNARQSKLAGVSRKHQPTVENPLLLVVVDEFAALAALSSVKKRVNESLPMLLTQGRAAAVTVFGALQDPSKDNIPYRDLFPTRIALRFAESDRADMVLGRGARQRGAECDRIPESMPGIGFVVREGVREPDRVRAAYVSDEDLKEMGGIYAPGSAKLAAVAA